MDELRASERTPENLTAQRRMLYGLLPPSISHEGYASKPAYSYWDVFWGLLGYKNAVTIAETLGKSDAAKEFMHGRDEFSARLLSLGALRRRDARHRLRAGRRRPRRL